jgi:hypothetical protein
MEDEPTEQAAEVATFYMKDVIDALERGEAPEYLLNDAEELRENIFDEFNFEKPENQ